MDWYEYGRQRMTDDFDADELTPEQRIYLAWRKTEPPVATLADAEILARRAFEHGLHLRRRPDSCGGVCLFCETDPGSDCNVRDHERCERCGHCLGNHLDSRPKR